MPFPIRVMPFGSMHCGPIRPDDADCDPQYDDCDDATADDN